jgi:hypothetical protein
VTASLPGGGFSFSISLTSSRGGVRRDLGDPAAGGSPVLLPVLPRRGLRWLVPVVPVTGSGPATRPRWRAPATTRYVGQTPGESPPVSHSLSMLKAVMSHRYRLYPTVAQEVVLRGHCGHARFVYNLGLEQRSWWRPGRRSIRFAEQCRQLTAVRAEFPWLVEGSAVVQQQALRDLAQAFANFLERPEHFGYPTFRGKGVNEGFRLVGQAFSVQELSTRWGAVWVPKAGRIRFRLSRPLPGGVKSCRIKRDRAGRWHVSFPIAQPAV